MNKNTKKELEENLPHFTGTENYHRVQQVGKKPVLATDGVKYLCETAACFWLIDIIASHQSAPMLHNEDFQTWKLTVNVEGTLRNGLTVNQGQTMIVCGNGNEALRSQSIPYTDFPMSEITLYVEHNDEKIVIMLPGEY